MVYSFPGRSNKQNWPAWILFGVLAFAAYSVQGFAIESPVQLRASQGQDDPVSDSDDLIDDEEDEIEGLEEDVQKGDDSPLDESQQEKLPVDAEQTEEIFWKEAVFEPARFTLQYDLGIGTESSSRVVVNRSSMRLEWESLLADRYFLRFDGKGEIMLANDHRTRAREGKDYYLNGDVREFFLQANYGDLSLKWGKQIVVWGEAEGSAITDVISPRDISEFLFTSLEDSRLQLQDRDTFHRGNLSYDITDSWNIELDAVVILAGDEDTNLGFFSKKDRVTATLRYYF